MAKRKEKTEEKKGELTLREKLKRINLYLIPVFIILIIVIVLILINKFKNWGIHVSLEDIKNMDREEQVYNNDELYIKTYERPEDMPDDGVTTVLILGNSIFGDDYYSDKNLAKMLEKKTDFRIINLSIPGSYVTPYNILPQYEVYFMDSFTPYWIYTTILYKDESPELITRMEYVINKMGDEAPENIRDVFEQIKTIDPKDIDICLFAYDGTDYFLNKPVSNPDMEFDFSTFAGGIVGFIDLVQKDTPWVDNIILSCPYAFAIDENGKYQSSDILKNEDGNTLSEYTAHELHFAYVRFVSYVDNIYGTITEDNASEYLKDNIHLNQAGRKLMLERLTEVFKKLGYIGKD